ncbi:unnamed protein product [Linum trigynum]|uniref:Uncharacterized protein n=1 Tax=Linum trigynum TaxID=586398 RepID=A0AAV2CMZ4_9ROSI
MYLVVQWPPAMCRFKTCHPRPLAAWWVDAPENLLQVGGGGVVTPLSLTQTTEGVTPCFTSTVATSPILGSSPAFIPESVRSFKVLTWCLTNQATRGRGWQVLKWHIAGGHCTTRCINFTTFARL